MSASLVEAQQLSDPRVADLVQAGKVRVGMHSFMDARDPQTGELKGTLSGIALLDITRALAARIGMEVFHSVGGSGANCRGGYEHAAFMCSDGRHCRFVLGIFYRAPFGSAGTRYHLRHPGHAEMGIY